VLLLIEFGAGAGRDELSQASCSQFAVAAACRRYRYTDRAVAMTMASTDAATNKATTRPAEPPPPLWLLSSSTPYAYGRRVVGRAEVGRSVVGRVAVVISGGGGGLYVDVDVTGGRVVAFVAALVGVGDGVEGFTAAAVALGSRMSAVWQW
jgi:hypothetical protein